MKSVVTIESDRISCQTDGRESENSLGKETGSKIEFKAMKMVSYLLDGASLRCQLVRL